MSRLASMTDALRSVCRRDPQGIVASTLDVVRELTQSSAAAWYRLGLVGDDALPSRWLLRGVDDVFVRPRVEERIGWPHADPRLPDLRWNRRFVMLRSVLDPDADLRRSALYERCHRPAGVHDILRLLVVHDGCFIGWIGALRLQGEPPFTRADVRRVAPAADAIADALVAADASERAACAADACDLVLRADGTVELASESSRALLVLPDAGAELRSFAKRLRAQCTAPQVLLGHHARWSRLSGAGGARVLVRLERLPPLRLHPTYVLTSTQREIAALAAAGATVREIGDMQGAAPATVRAHLREIYARLHVTCRAELALSIERAPGEGSIAA